MKRRCTRARPNRARKTLSVNKGNYFANQASTYIKRELEEVIITLDDDDGGGGNNNNINVSFRFIIFFIANAHISSVQSI